VECNPRGGGGRSGGGNATGGGKAAGSSGGKNSRGTYYLVGGLYPAWKPLKDEKTESAPVKKEVHAAKNSIGAFGIVAIVLVVIAMCSAIYYGLYLCELCKKKSNYSSNLACQNMQFMLDKQRLEENGNGNIPMINMNETAQVAVAAQENKPNEVLH